jgi:hypothetical protein
MDFREETTDAAEIKQWHKEPRPETAAMTGKQGKYYQDFLADHIAGGYKANSWNFH